MSKLLKSTMLRARCSLSFCLSMAFILVWNCLMLFANYETMRKNGTDCSLEEIMFSFLFVAGIALAVVVSLLIGTDYSDGAIRNKVIVGHTRKNIYAANFFTCALTGVIFCAWGILVNLAIGIPLFGMPQLTAKSLAILMIDSMLACVAYASIYTMISMLCSNKTHSAILCILISIALFFLSGFLYSMLIQPEMIETAVMRDGETIIEMMENPDYLTGMKREICQFFMDLLPSGQCAQIANLGVIHPYRLGIFSLLTIIITNAVGLWGFHKKDIR